jgi:cobaltochelatase CobN
VTTICYYSATSAELSVLSDAVRTMTGTCPDLRLIARTQAQLDDESRVASFVRRALRCDAIVLSLHGGEPSCPAWEPLLDELRSRGDAGDPIPYVHVQPEDGQDDAVLAARDVVAGLDDGTWAGVSLLLRRGGPVNVRTALEVIVGRLAGGTDDVPQPSPVPFEGIHHPDHGDFTDLGTYLDAAGATAGGRPVVGLLFPQIYWLNRNTAHVDALVHEVEARGAVAVPVFCHRLKDASLGNLGIDEVVRAFFTRDGETIIDVLVNVMAMSMTMADRRTSHVYPGLDVPVLQAMTSVGSAERWRAGPQGLATMDVAPQAAQPEFDGALITVAVATRELDTVDPVTGALLARLVPLRDRVARLADLALRWAALRRLPNPEKRVAVIFHHHPPRNDRIGCAAGLDTFASVRLLLSAMAERGYRIEESYPDADSLARVLRERLTCDQRWLTPEQLVERAEARAGRDLFGPWHEELPEAVRRRMTETWGPVPGDLFVDADQLGFAGHVNGNVFLTVQPPRGDLEKAGEALHDLALPPPHHYLAHYRWIRDVFGAHAVVHVGTHGSLEWLPGKALGLSQECYPDLALRDLPDIYPYIINNPGEGTQAKRRAAAALVDHLTPPMRAADLYDETAEADRALSEYIEATTSDPGKLPTLLSLLWDAVEAADLHEDLGVTRQEALSDPQPFVERLHDYLTDLADTAISDGLHVLGHGPGGEELVRYLVQLTRLPNGDVPGLLDETGGDRSVAEKLVRALAATGYDADRVDDVVREVLGTTAPGVEEVLGYIAGSLVARLERTADELTSVLAALEGRFVAPGPSGAPTRGNADILPTGRNFFSLDPRCLPSRGAWEIGVALATSLLERHLSQEGRYPDNVGIIVWGTNNMRTKGEDIAEILFLLGLRPRWRGNGHVEGLDVIPVEELGRPRIDITARISGFFRDAFPNLVEMLDKAVRMTAGLAEPPEDNHLRAHVLSERDDLRRQGVPDDEAWRTATLRVFGCPPGTYGAGVAELIESKRWETVDDLAAAYIRYSAHAYGVGLYGAREPEAFRRRLAQMDVTVKNEDTREWDMLSCTDFYNYHGGLIAAATSVRGTKPLSVVGDTSDPRRAVVRSVEEETAFVLRARILNPTWVEGLRRHGFKGAGDLSKVLDILLGWDATADVMDDWMWDRVADRYALDPDMREWFSQVNPHALHNITDKLLDALRRGMWTTTPERSSALEAAYLAAEGDIEETLDGGL